MRASLAIAKASLLAMLRSPTSVVFSLLFPIIFIVVFGTMVDTTQVIIKVGLSPNCDTNSLVFKSMSKVSMLHLIPYESEAQLREDLARGRLTAILDIKPDSKTPFVPHYQISLLSSGASTVKAPLVQTIINDLVSELDKRLFTKNYSVAILTTETTKGRLYHSIDFILPGQLGFSLLMAGVFGSSFLFFNLRQSLVLKRFFATPIKRSYLILGEMLSRLFFQVIGFIIMVSLGHFLFNFTLINGLLTFAEMLLFSIFGLIIFMGIGFIISGFLENESSIAPVANTITLPQILLCGLFFPVENYPHWLQSFCKILPLTFLVDGLRKIAFEGSHFWQMPIQLGGLVCWSLIISLITIKVFRWE
jgi:ABC-2 type transport system permease protein